MAIGSVPNKLKLEIYSINFGNQDKCKITQL